MGRFATTIFNEKHHFNIVAIVLNGCNIVHDNIATLWLRKKLALRVVPCNITLKITLNLAATLLVILF